MRKLILIITVVYISINSFAQNSVGIGTTTPNGKSLLELSSTTQGFLPPRVTDAQMTAIGAGAAADNGMFVFNTDQNEFYFFDFAGGAWKPVGGADSDWVTNGANIYNGNTGNVGIATNNPLTSLQIGPQFHFDSAFGGLYGLITRNIVYDGLGFARSVAGTGQLMYMGDGGKGEFSFQTLDNAAAGAYGNTLSNLTLDEDGVLVEITNPTVSPDDVAIGISPYNDAAIGLGISNNSGNPSQLRFLDNNGNYIALRGISPLGGSNYIYTLPATYPGSVGDVLSSDLAGNMSWITPSSGSVEDSTRLIDADGDTKIEVERTPDQDIIHFNLGDATNTSTEHFTMIGPRLEVINSGNSIFLGELAGANDDLSNNNNVYIGREAGSAGVSAQSNTLIGYQAGMSGNKNGNTAIGIMANRNGASGNDNTVVGAYAGFNNTGTRSVILGYTAGYQNTGNFVVSIGQGAGYNNTFGDGIFIGRDAGNSNTSGQENIAIGYHALQLNSTGGYNVAIGYRSQERNTAFGNTAVGDYTLVNNITGTNNVAMGRDALRNATSGQNVSIGSSSQYSTSTGQNNTSLGYYSLRNNSTGSNNVGVGRNAGDINTIGIENTFLGYNADASTNSLSNATAVGANALVTASDRVKLGDNADVEFDNALMPAGDAGGAGEVLTSQGVGAAPIWTTLPAADGNGIYGGSGTVPGATAVALTNTINFDANTLLIDGTNNKLGVGTTNISQKMDIENAGLWSLAGTALGVDNLFLKNLSAVDGQNAVGGSISFSGAGHGGGVGANRRHAAIAGIQSGTDNDQVGLSFYTHNATSSGANMQESMRLTHDGKLGIGAPNPTEFLEVKSTTAAVRAVLDAGANQPTELQFREGGVYRGAVGFSNTAGQDYLYLYNGGTALIAKGGQVNIGDTSDPSQELDVEGSVEIDGEYYYETAKTHYQSFHIAAFRIAGADANTVVENFAPTNSNMTYTYRSGSTTGYLVAPVQLPDGATITNISFYCYSSVAGMNMSLCYTTNATHSIAATTNTSGTGGFQTPTASPSHVVNNSTRSYYLRLNFTNTGTSQRLYNAKITYTVPKAD